MINIKNICVYCGSSSAVNQSYKDCAVELGKLMASKNIGLVYGGGQVGLMGLIADSIMSNNGKVIGIIPHFLDKLEVGKYDVTELIKTDNMHVRKMKMAELSDAFIVLPGGLGTLDETFEILTWKQLGLHNKPIIILNIDGFWDKLINLIDHQISENFATIKNRKLFDIAASSAEAIDILYKYRPYDNDIKSKWT